MTYEHTTDKKLKFFQLPYLGWDATMEAMEVEILIIEFLRKSHQYAILQPHCETAYPGEINCTVV